MATLPDLLAAIADPRGPVAGYIEPGSGGFLLQLVLAGVAAVVVALRRAWPRLTRFVTPPFGRTRRTAVNDALEPTGSGGDERRPPSA